MTFEEALKALKEGKKVRQKVWQDYEYITLKCNVIVTQSGNVSGMLLESLYKDCWEEVKDIINTKEKEYLKAVIKPFRDRVVNICKEEVGECSQFISIKVKKYDYDEDQSHEYIDLPYFKKDTLYKNMEVDKDYTLEELGL